MHHHRLLLATLALTAMLSMPTAAQAPQSWTQVGSLSCKVNPNIGFIIAGHQPLECLFTPNDPYSASSLRRCDQHCGSKRRHQRWWCVGLDRVCADHRHFSGGTGRRLCRSFRGYWPWRRRWRQCPARRLRPHLRATAALAPRLSRSQRGAWCVNTNIALALNGHPTRRLGQFNAAGRSYAPNVCFWPMLLKKASRLSANSDSVCLRLSAAEVCHDGSADGRSEPVILSFQP